MASQTERSSNSLASISEIYSERASFELNEDDVHALRRRFDSLASLKETARSSAAAAEAEERAVEFQKWKARHPSLLDNFEQFQHRAKGKRVTLFLDYDGTLAPIVKDPELAYMSEQMRAAVRGVASLVPTAIISGRGRQKVAAFVQLQELFYAGSHGLDIAGPRANGKPGMVFQPAAQFAPTMDAVFHALQNKVAAIPGATVEHNTFCVSVHFRNCPPSTWQQVSEVVEEVLQAHPDLHSTRGRKVLEIRPKVNWDKGCALTHLLEALGLGEGEEVLSLYVGDDRTDEDAFRACSARPHGFGVLVSCKAKATDAAYTLSDPAEVNTFLEMMVAWGRSDHNVWRDAKSCIGWSYAPLPSESAPSTRPHLEAPAAAAPRPPAAASAAAASMFSKHAATEDLSHTPVVASPKKEAAVSCLENGSASNDDSCSPITALAEQQVGQGDQSRDLGEVALPNTLESPPAITDDDARAEEQSASCHHPAGHLPYHSTISADGHPPTSG